MERDPRSDPHEGDALLTEDGAIVIGSVDPEVMYGCGDHRYWFLPLPEWRKQMADAKVLHVSEEA